MKPLIPKKSVKIEKPKKRIPFVRKPTPIPTNKPKEICRVLPFYVAENFDYFQLLPFPKYKPKDINKYVLRIKQKISCLKSEL